MIYLRILIIVLLLILFILGTDTIMRFKKLKNEKIEDIRKPFIIRIDILMVLTIIIAILSIVHIILNIK